MILQHRNDGWVIHTPAKINLALEVFGRRGDGFHQLETLLVPLRLWDTLVYRPSGEPFRLQIVDTPRGDFADLVDAPQHNLVTKAANLIATAAGHPLTGLLRLIKRIPSQAGLGGGSSDAAAALALLNRAWRLGFSHERLTKLAIQLGTDVPFFLQGGAALGTGCGERLEAIDLPAGIPIVLAKPAAGLSTQRVFANLGLTAGEQVGNIAHRCRRIVEHLKQKTSIAAWSHLVRNSLQSPAARLLDSVQQLAHRFANLPVLAHQMTGSGSGYFGICHTYRQAKAIAARLRSQPDYWAIATSTGP